MIDIFLLVVTIANCILFVLILNWCISIKLFYDSTCTKEVPNAIPTNDTNQ